VRSSSVKFNPVPTNASLDEFPFIVGIQEGGNIKCAGSIVDATFILTSGSCVDGFSPEQIGIVIPSNILGLSAKVSSVIVHENYSLNLNDIALLKLSVPLVFNNHVSPAQLPKPTGNVIHPGLSLIGLSFTNSSVLQKVDLQTIPLSKCSSQTGSRIPKSNICTAPIVGICHGDSGGPLFSYENSAATLVGLSFSYAVSCEQNNRPKAFTRVSAYINWINANINASIIVVQGEN